MVFRNAGLAPKISILLPVLACGSPDWEGYEDAGISGDAGSLNDAHEPCVAAPVKDRIAHVRREAPGNFSVPAVSCRSLDNAVQLGGSVMFFDVFNPLIAFADIGFLSSYVPDNPVDSTWLYNTTWAGFDDIGNIPGEVARRVHFAVCLYPHTTNDCEWELEPVAVVSHRMAMAGTVTDLRFGCPNDEVLVNGSCDRTLIRDPGQLPGDVAIASHGFTVPFQEWSCVVSNLSQVNAEVEMTAVCLKPFIQTRCGGCTATPDLIQLISTTAELGVGTNQLRVECPASRRLLLGNCAIDAPVEVMGRLTMFGTGYTGDTRPGNTWECGWNNRDGIVGTATAHALCMY
ncbi:MAG: hypothetical protein MJE77_29700 [Proteobacteria bacterium]|nr:hypothetical protein [Pseudomonadota bacterium]